MRRGFLFVATVLVMIGAGSAVAFGLSSIPIGTVEVPESAVREQYGPPDPKTFEEVCEAVGGEVVQPISGVGCLGVFTEEELAQLEGSCDESFFIAFEVAVCGPE